MDTTSFYFSFAGRISRRDVWLKAVLVSVIISVIIFILDAMVGADSMLVYIWNVLALWPAFAVYSKRLHDRNRSGWWSLVFAVGYLPLFGDIYLELMESAPLALVYFGFLLVTLWLAVEILFLKGTDGDNRFGPQPATRAAGMVTQ